MQALVKLAKSREYGAVGKGLGRKTGRGRLKPSPLDQNAHSKKSKSAAEQALHEWARLDSNQGPTDYESAV
jgi:hypothetical protein